MKPTLGEVFALSLLGLAAVLGLLFYVVFDASRAAIIESSERIREGASREISERVTGFLEKAPETVEGLQLALNRGLLDPNDLPGAEAALFAPLLANQNIGEITLTYGHKNGFAEDGAIQLAATPRGQLTVARTADAHGGDQFWSRHVHQEGGVFIANRRELERSDRFVALPVTREPGPPLPDPTSHPTFTTPASEDFHGTLLPSDLHWSQLDAHLPEPERRVEVSVQQVVTDAAGEFAGVLRVGLLAQQLDRAVQLKLTPDGSDDPHRIFICDAQGRLITRGIRTDRFQEYGDDLRISPDALPEPILRALGDLRSRGVSDTSPIVSGQFSLNGEEFLTTFRALSKTQTQSWIVGIVVPRSFYLGKLAAMRERLLKVSLGIMLLLVVTGSLILRGVKGAQAQITRESLKMNAFEFAPAGTKSAFRDVSAVLESLEKAKTAMRAMGKYVPIDLVRRLYREKSEPVLGGESMEVSIMFTDIEGFTALSEQLAPNELAGALGRYLEVMTRIIQKETGGTIDKYIGDAIMTFWNAPEPVANHASMACLAALRCRDAGRALAQSPGWPGGLPPFETRFGLHRGIALVGHFGAPDRMNYTAIGDAINLASRLESLNKQYGTTIIASDRVVEKASGEFDFRFLDLVAVKGKSEAIKIHELIGKKGAAGEVHETAAIYEEALAAYLQRDFAGAMERLSRIPTDPPGAVLLARCREFLQAPPPPDWSGIYLAKTK